MTAERTILADVPALNCEFSQLNGRAHSRLLSPLQAALRDVARETRVQDESPLPFFQNPYRL
jgi:hypothetical protein